jgi:hypothetical protein
MLAAAGDMELAQQLLFAWHWVGRQSQQHVIISAP